MTRTGAGLVTMAAVVGLWPGGASAQVVGTFRWQLQPHCNVLTLTVTQRAGGFTLEGTDDLCAPGGNQSGTIGVAFVNPDGRIGLSVSTVQTSSAQPVHTTAIVSPATVNGAWRDSAGNSGAFTFVPGGSTGGVPRFVPVGGLPPASIAEFLLAPGAVTSSKVAPNAINNTTQIAANTIELSDLRQQFLVGTGFFDDIPAGGCVLRENVGAGVAAVQVGDLLLAEPQNVPAGAYTVPMVAGANGRFGMMVCNPTAAAMNNVPLSLGLRRVPR